MWEVVDLELMLCWSGNWDREGLEGRGRRRGDEKFVLLDLCELYVNSMQTLSGDSEGFHPVVSTLRILQPRLQLFSSFFCLAPSASLGL